MHTIIELTLVEHGIIETGAVDALATLYATQIVAFTDCGRGEFS